MSFLLPPPTLDVRLRMSVFCGRARQTHHARWIAVARTTTKAQSLGEFHTTVYGPVNSCTGGEDDPVTLADATPFVGLAISDARVLHQNFPGLLACTEANDGAHLAEDSGVPSRSKWEDVRLFAIQYVLL